jgi:cell division protein FtsW (lipid II flippase)
MARTLKSDAVLFSTTLLLLVIGMACVYSASTVKGDAGVAIQQGKFLVLGLAGLFVALKIDYRHLCNRPALLWAIGVMVVLLVAVLVFGHEVKGARRWITVLGLRFQPSELAKFVAIAFAATVLGRRLEEGEPLEPAWFQAGVVVALFAILIFLEKDMGGGIVLLAAGFAIVFVSGLAYRWVTIAVSVGLPVLVGVLLLVPHSRDRCRPGCTPTPILWARGSRRFSRTSPSAPAASGARDSWRAFRRCSTCPKRRTTTSSP